MKACIKCNIEKDMSMFQASKGRHGKISIRNTCKACKSAIDRARINSSPELLAKDRARYVGRTRVNEKDIQARYWASDKGLAKRLELSEIRKHATIERSMGRYCRVTPIHCPCCDTLIVVKGNLDLKPKHKRVCPSCTRKVATLGLKMPRRRRKCLDCNTSYIGAGRSMYCASCAKKRNNIGNSNIMSRARHAGVYREAVNRLKVYKRDRYKCRYCECKVVRNDSMKPNMATLDHVIPLHIGGEHTYSNVVTCCFRCNSAKSGTIIEGTQVSLFTNIQEDKVGTYRGPVLSLR